MTSSPFVVKLIKATAFICHLFTLLFFTGIPTLLYGLAAVWLIRHKELVETPDGSVYIYFLLLEDKGSMY